MGFDPWVGKIPWRRKWQPTPVFLPGKSHGQRSMSGSMGSQKSQTGLSNWGGARPGRGLRRWPRTGQPLNVRPSIFLKCCTCYAFIIIKVHACFRKFRNLQTSPFIKNLSYSVPFSECSITKLCPTLCDPMDCSKPVSFVLCYLPGFAQIHVHWVNDAI